MKPKKKLRVYFTHDTEDVELIHLLVEILKYTGIFDIFISPFDLPGVVPQLDATKVAEIGDCDLFIVLLTRRSSRTKLVKHEIEYARMENKTIIPLMEHSAKIPKLSELTGHLYVIQFIRKNAVKAAQHVLTNVSLLQNKLGISGDLITRAQKAVENYPKQSFRLEMLRVSKVATFKKVVFEVLKNLGYSVLGAPFFFLTYHKGFDLIMKKKKRCIGIDCIPREIVIRDVAKTARYAGLVDERWIVCTGFTPKAKELAIAEGISIVFIPKLLDELNPRARQHLEQKFAQVMHTKDGFMVNYQFYPELKASLRATRLAKTSAEKGKSLERLAECFVKLFPNLEVVGRNVRIEDEELDLVVKNENEKIFWQRLKAPIIIECKNWTKPVGAPQIRDLVQKMREVRTAFLIAAQGVTYKKGAYYEIIEARKKGKFILVLDLEDIEDILRGVNPEEIIQEKFYSLWTRAR